MPKLSYGPAAKKRTLALLMMLVDYGNDELEVSDDGMLERLRSQLNLHWATDRQLIVRTKLRTLEALSQLISQEQALSKAQIKTGLHHLEHHVLLLEDNRTSRRGSDVWHFTITLGCHRRDRTALMDRFNQTWEQRRRGVAIAEAPLSQASMEPLATPNPWQQRCQQLLATTHQGMISRLFPQQGTRRIDPADLHRPLTLVEHRLPSESEAMPMATSELFNHMGQLPPSRHLAIVGEPGAGKSTLLQQLAQQILEQTSTDIPIVIPLAQVGATSLEDYILGDWLQLCLGKRTVPPEVQAELVALIEQGHGWLLLDGVDEMADGGSVALARLAQQLRGWLGHGPMVLTCRLNLWDAGKNALGHLPTYRLLGYESYGQQIKPFIRQWFAQQPEVGESLCQTLSLPEHRRLRNNLRNPLRLVLFCQLGSGGQLPVTQYQLYQQFVIALYDWQQDSFPTSLLDQHRINQVLSKLAMATLQAATAQFTLAQVMQTLMPEDLPWFEQAVQLGWLFPVPTPTGEKVYGFLHGTFRDYFAAQAMDQWERFTTVTDHGLPMVLPQWQTVILLWLGRSDIPAAAKNELIGNLIRFSDGCGHFFEYRTWLLAGRALGEHGDCPHGDDIIQRLFEWRFNLTRKVSPLLIEAAKAALAESDLGRVSQRLERLAQDSTQDLFDRWMAAYSLGRSYVPQSKVAVTTLENLLSEVRSDSLKMDMARHLGILVPGHPLAVEVLTTIIQTVPAAATQRKAALRLARVSGAHPLPIETLEKLLVAQPGSQATMKALALVQPEHPLISCSANAQESNSKARRLKRRKKHRLSEPSRLVESLLTRLAREGCDRNRLRLARQLNQLQPGHPVAIEHLWHIVVNSQDMTDLKLSAEAIEKGATEEKIPRLVTQLRHLYGEATLSEQQRLVYFRLLWVWADALGYQTFMSAWQADP